MGACASIVVVLINVFLKKMIGILTDQEKHTSLSKRDAGVMGKVAVCQTFNTAAIVFLLNYNGLGIFKGDFSDFERGWYAVVGSAIALNMLLNAFMGAAVNLLMVIVGALKRWRCCCCCSLQTRVKHQAELLDIFENPPFDLAGRYAQIMMTVFCTVIYSPGIPVLNFFAVIYFFLNYWVDKLVLLGYSRRPPSYDGTMPKQALEMLMLAPPIHCLFCIGMYSHACTFPSNPLGGSLASMADQAQDQSSGDGAENTIADRVSRECTWMSFVICALFAAALVLVLLRLILGATFGSMLASCRTICCPNYGRVAPSDMVCEDGEEVTFEAARDWIDKCRPPASFRMEENRKIRPLMRFLREDFQTSRENFLKAESSNPSSPAGAAGDEKGAADDVAPVTRAESPDPDPEGERSAAASSAKPEEEEPPKLGEEEPPKLGEMTAEDACEDA
jgi:hypothetical protein